MYAKTHFTIRVYSNMRSNYVDFIISIPISPFKACRLRCICWQLINLIKMVFFLNMARINAFTF